MKLTPEIIKKLEENLSKVENYEDLISEDGGFRKILENTIKKPERNLGPFEERIISLYGKGFSAGEIQNRLNTVFGRRINIEIISEVIDSIAVMTKEWHNRPLEKMYVMVYFDAILSKVKDSGKTLLKTAHTCVGIDIQGHRDLLGIWITSPGENTFWQRVLTDIKNRGTEDILIVSVEGIKNFSEASKDIFPGCLVQKCILPQLRSSLQYIATKDMKEFTHNLKEVYYSAPEETTALLALDNFEGKWINKYKPAVKPWRDNWNEIKGCFQFPEEIRKMINSTNAFEVFHNQLDKSIKIKSVFQDDNALIEMLFLACRNISKKWGKYPIKNWKPILAELSVFFEDRVKAYL